MKLLGYARVSTTDQDTTIQQAALKKAGCDIVLDEQVSGTKRDGRDKLKLALQVLDKGDVLVVTRLDRLGRSLRDLSNIVHDLEQKGATLRVLEQNVDTSTSAGRAFFGMLATFAQFETDVRKERQMEGIARVKSDPALRKQKYRGRPQADRAAVLELASQDRGPSFIAAKLGIHRVTVHRILKGEKA
jgi:DNA invertase Pin-like site-specific DNA recombinase